MSIPVILVALVIIGGLLAEMYIRRARRSYANAGRVWVMVRESASAIVEGNFPREAKEIALDLALAAGCGCFVRGVLLQHWVPTIMAATRHHRRGSGPNQVEATMNALTQSQRKRMDTLIGAVLVYDSLANPLLGYLFRRAIRSFSRVPRRSSDLPRTNAEVRKPLPSVVRRGRKVERHLCAA